MVARQSVSGRSGDQAVGLAATHSIAARMHERFQPSGDRSLSWPEFFGGENLGLIVNVKNVHPTKTMNFSSGLSILYTFIKNY